MSRPYRAQTFQDILNQIRERIPHACLEHVIVGFPGETDEEFERTYDFVARSGLNYAHVFSYSDDLVSHLLVCATK